MNLEQLQAMSDDELNELSAVKVMGWNCIKRDGVDFVRYYDEKDEYTGYRSDRWFPTNDMNDAMVLLDVIKTEHDHVIMEYSSVMNPSFWTVSVTDFIVVNGEEFPEERNVTVDTDSLPRAITIASILAKESE